LRRKRINRKRRAINENKHQRKKANENLDQALVLGVLINSEVEK